MSDYAEILSRFNRLRPGRKSDEWYASCPVAPNHKSDDKHPSLLLGIGDTGCLTATCQKGCKWDEIVAAVGSKPADWFPPKDGKQRERRIGFSEKFFDYYNEDGELAYQSVRKEWFFADTRKKHVYHRKPNGSGGFDNNLDGVPPTLYNLPEMLEFPPHDIVVVEGEPKVELLRSWGILATCNSGGAKAWQRCLARYLGGRFVTVCPDNDEPGRNWAAAVLGSVFMYGAHGAGLLELPCLPESGDVVDWSLAGGTGERFEELLSRVVKWSPSFNFGKVSS